MQPQDWLQGWPAGSSADHRWKEDGPPERGGAPPWLSPATRPAVGGTASPRQPVSLPLCCEADPLARVAGSSRRAKPSLCDEALCARCPSPRKKHGERRSNTHSLSSRASPINNGWCASHPGTSAEHGQIYVLQKMTPLSSAVNSLPPCRHVPGLPSGCRQTQRREMASGCHHTSFPGGEPSSGVGPHCLATWPGRPGGAAGGQTEEGLSGPVWGMGTKAVSHLCVPGPGGSARLPLS